MKVTELVGPRTRGERLMRHLAQTPHATIYEFECLRGCLKFEASRLPDLTVLMLGSPGTGKTTYIGSLAVARHLPSWFLPQIDTSPEGKRGDNRLAKQWHSMFGEFWGKKTALDYTGKKADHEPILANEANKPIALKGNYGFYPMSVSCPHTNPLNPLTLLMDMPGEAFTTNVRDLLNHAPGIRKVPLVILCVDPEAGSEQHAAAVLATVGDLRRQPGHLALVYTKSDLLWDEPGFPPSLKANPEPGLDPDSYIEQLEADSAAAREYLVKTDRSGLVPFADQFASASFHMVSATSCTPRPDPDNATLFRYEKVEPVRVLDPFIYFYLSRRRPS